MNFIVKEPRENSPALQLLMLIAYALLGAFVFTILGIILIYLGLGSAAVSDIVGMSASPELNKPALQILLISSSIGFFLVPPILLSITEGIRIKDFYGFHGPNIKIISLVILIMVVSMPIMEWVALLNQKMTLPDALKPLEQWIRNKEDEAMATTLLLLQMKTVTDFLINICSIAIVPAVVEELMFRGGVQRTFSRMTGNPHAAIWISACLFSAIHIQFYGFVPRLLLGAGFGYIYYFSGSIWYAMLAHFINNAYAVFAAWYMQRNNLPMTGTESTMDIPWYGYLLSAILTIAAFIYFSKQSPRYGQQQLG